MPLQHAHVLIPQKITLKALLNTFRTCHKTHGILTRYGSHDTKDVSATQDSPPQNLAPEEQPMPEGDDESSKEYCEETDTHHPLAELLEQFCQLKDQFASLKSTTLQSTPIAKLSQLTDQLQHLTMMLHLAPQSSEEQVHKTMQAGCKMDTLHAIQTESNLTTTMLQDIPTFDGQDSSKLEDWFADIYKATQIGHC